MPPGRGRGGRGGRRRCRRRPRRCWRTWRSSSSPWFLDRPRWCRRRAATGSRSGTAPGPSASTRCRGSTTSRAASSTSSSSRQATASSPRAPPGRRSSGARPLGLRCASSAKTWTTRNSTRCRCSQTATASSASPRTCARSSGARGPARRCCAWTSAACAPRTRRPWVSAPPKLALWAGSPPNAGGSCGRRGSGCPHAAADADARGRGAGRPCAAGFGGRRRSRPRRDADDWLLLLFTRSDVVHPSGTTGLSILRRRARPIGPAPATRVPRPGGAEVHARLRDDAASVAADAARALAAPQ